MPLDAYVALVLIVTGLIALVVAVLDSSTHGR